MGLREVIGDDLHISVSAVKAYLRCPRSFELKYVRGVPPQFVPYPMAFGTAIHSALAGFYGARKALGETITVERLVELFKAKWEVLASGPVPIQRDDPDEPGEDPVALATRMLRVFHDHAADDHSEVLEVEKPFSVSLFDPENGEVLEEKLVGVFDLLVRDGENLLIVEHKTSGRKYGQDQVKFDIQPTAYVLAAREMGNEVAGVQFQVLTKTKTAQVQVEIATRSAEDEDDFRRIAVGVLRAIDSGAFYPLRGWQCRTCPYAHACRGAGA